MRRTKMLRGWRENDAKISNVWSISRRSPTLFDYLKLPDYYGCNLTKYITNNRVFVLTHTRISYSNALSRFFEPYDRTFLEAKKTCESYLLVQLILLYFYIVHWTSTHSERFFSVHFRRMDPSSGNSRERVAHWSISDCNFNEWREILKKKDKETKNLTKER